MLRVAAEREVAVVVMSGSRSGAFTVYATMDQRLPLSRVAAHARRAEALGYDGLAIPEAVHDGLLAAATALQATTRLKVATSVLIAFPRSPMVVAHAAWDLQEVSGGRFELGLGSQVRGNIVGRYSTSWSSPVPRMREYVHSLRAIFTCWQNGTPLRFEGEHYRFTRLQPFFSPGPLEHAAIPIFLGGVGRAMTALAGEVSDGLMTHPTNTCSRYLREVLWPQIEKGAARVARDATAVKVLVSPLIATGRSAAEVRQERERIRQLLAWLYSTPNYWPSLELFGWRDRGEHLHQLSREGRWDEMTAVVSDELLDAFVPSAPFSEITDVLGEWYGCLTDWITFPLSADATHDHEVAKVVARLRKRDSELVSG
jgi:probable F420-dependent oxidoreductase